MINIFDLFRTSLNESVISQAASQLARQPLKSKCCEYVSVTNRMRRFPIMKEIIDSPTGPKFLAQWKISFSIDNSAIFHIHLENGGLHFLPKNISPLLRLSFTQESLFSYSRTSIWIPSTVSSRSLKRASSSVIAWNCNERVTNIHMVNYFGCYY